MENNPAGKGVIAFISVVGTFFIAKTLHAPDLLAALITILITTAVGWWALRQ